MFEYEISSRHVPTIVHLINMILKGSILFFSCIFRQKPRMISACSLLSHTPSTWTTPWMSAAKKQVFPSGWAFQAYLNSASTKMTPNTPSQFRSFAAILARWEIVCLFLFSWPPHNLLSSNKTKQTQQMYNLCKSTIHLKIICKASLPILSPVLQLCEGHSGTGVGPVHVEVGWFDASPRVPAAPALLAAVLCLWGVQTDLQRLWHPLHHRGIPGRRVWAHHHPEQGEAGEIR